jgi:DNA-binding CsgD family transcriptional regulator/tetratricopeptide (TPR) repeat protein
VGVSCARDAAARMLTGDLGRVMIALLMAPSVPGPGLPPAGGRTDRPRRPFVGRERELARLTECLAAARCGDFAIVLLSGEPGVGKTRLLTELGTHAAASGWQVLVGQALESQGMPPYLPFLEALREHVRACPVDDLKAQLGDGAPEIARVLPDVSRRLPDLPSGRNRDPESDRYRLFDALSEFVFAIAAHDNRGLLLCLDDLQWADDSTLLLLEHMCRRLAKGQLLIVASFRDTDLDVSAPLARTLDHLDRQPIAHRLDLAPLDLEGVRSMLAELGRPHPPAALVDAVYSETEGNPFFVHQVFDWFADEGRLFDASGAWRSKLEVGPADVPRSIRFVIGRRLARLGPECRRALATAAVLGRIFDFDLLRTMLDIADEALLDVLEEAEVAHIVVSDERGRLAFGHELTRQTLLATMTALRRQRLHLHAAEAMNVSYAGAIDARLAEIADHYRQAGAAADPAELFDYAVRAGEQALEVRAFEESVRLFGEALGAVERAPGRVARDARLIDLHRKCGQAFSSLARWQDARRELEAALSMLTTEPTAERSALLIDLALACRWDGDLKASRRCAEEARDIAEYQHRHDLHAGALAAIALLEFSEGDIVSGASSYQHAIERARDIAPTVSKTAEAMYTHLLYLGGRHVESVEHGLQAVSLAREVGDMTTLTLALGPLGLSLAAAGRYQEAEEVFAQARQVGREYRIEGYLARAVSMSATPHLDLFDFEGALEIVQEAGELGHRFGYVQTQVSSAIDALVIQLRSGRLSAAFEALPGVRDLVAGRVNAKGTWQHGWLWSLRLAQIESDVALARGDWREAARLAMLSISESQARARPKYTAAGLATRGQALAALGRKKAGMADLTAAAELARRIGAPALFVRTSATMLRVEPDARLAREANDSVTRIFDAISNPRLRRSFAESDTVRLIQSLRGSAATRPVKQESYPDGLSQREVEVLRLVAAGKTNSYIADELVISVNTVQRHVGNILHKTRMENRTQAASYAQRAGIV